MREQLGSSVSGLSEVPQPTWWANRNPGLRYVRCELPARQLGGHVDFLGDAVRDGRLDLHTGTQIVQLAATRDQFDLIRVWRERGQKVLVEFDDDYTRWDEELGRGRRGTPWEKHDRDSPDRWSPSVEMARACAKEADGVIVSTQHLGRVYGAMNGNVHVCQNSVEPADWPELKWRDGPFRVVFAGAPFQHDLAMIRKAMEWAAAQPDAEAIVVGADPGWPGVRCVPWVNDLALLREFLVGLAPDVGLRPFEPTRFAQGKSDLKVLEYAMAGAVSIVSPGEPYKNWEGLAWFARSSGEFLDRVRMAYGNSALVRAQAVLTREAVLTSRTIGHEAQAWTAALRSSRAAHKISA